MKAEKTYILDYDIIARYHDSTFGPKNWLGKWGTGVDIKANWEVKFAA